MHSINQRRVENVIVAGDRGIAPNEKGFKGNNNQTQCVMGLKS